MKSTNFARQCLGDQGSADTSLDSVCSSRQVSGVATDVHLFQSSEGRDAIFDADGQGTIKLATAQQPYILWQDNSQIDQPIRYQLHTATRELTITGAGSTIIVKGFDAGDLGIRVPAASVPVVPTPEYVFDLSTSAGRTALGALTPQQRQANLPLNNAVIANGLYLVARIGSGNDLFEGAVAQSVLLGCENNDALVGILAIKQAANDFSWRIAACSA